MVSCFEIFNKNILLTEKDEELFRNTDVRQICEKKTESDKVGDHCHLTGKY